MARNGVKDEYLNQLIQRNTMPFDLVYAEIGEENNLGETIVPVRVSNAGRFVTINSVAVDPIADINLNGTYIPQSDLISIAAIEEDANFQIGEVRITLSGVTGAQIAQLLGSPYLDRAVKIWRGLFDSEYNVVGDPVLIFDGKISGAAIEDNPAGGKSTVSITVSSQWVDFERRNGNKTNDAEQQFRFPGDKGLEFAAETIRNIEWGRG